ncbi:MAG: spore germination protein [Lachnospiraceae bacterium]|nr:spore germination protein [Lachnospiraceae bacterium]
MEYKMGKDLDANVNHFNEVLAVDQSFDLMHRVFEIAGKKACFYFIDGFAKDDMLQKIMQYFMGLKEEDNPKDIYELLKKDVPYAEIDKVSKEDDIITNVLSGVSVLFVDGCDEAIAIDCRTYPARSVDEPEKDKVLRGSRDGFVETIVFNTALIRRRIRSPSLIMKMMQVGKSSKTDVVVSYMDDRVDHKLLEEVIKKIENVQVDSLSMNQESLVECIDKRRWYNPFPKYKYSERPDTTAACLLEGSIVILVDTSPAAMILPASLFSITEEADEYYFPPITGTYLRLSHMIITIVALLITPTFLLLMKNPEWIPDSFQFIKVKEDINISLIWQFLILEFALDGLRLAAVSTPDMLNTPLSIVAGLILGDFTVSSGWFNAETMLYMAFVAIANYTQTSFELGYALKFFRIILLLATNWFNIWGYVGGLIFVVVCFACNKTITGKRYLYPLIPFNARELGHRFFRVSLPKSRNQ